MSKTKITAPVTGYTGPGPAGIAFEDGVAYTDDPAAISYCAGAGYLVDDEPGPLDESEIQALRDRLRAEGHDVPADLDEQLKTADPAKVRQLLADPADPRDLPEGGTQVGTALRDAAVDPHPEDFLPPTNAGIENPHGPLVVAPGIHAGGVQPIRPGHVHVDDVDKQQELELAQAQQVLVDNTDVGEATGTFTDAAADGTGPLGLSDPGSAPAGNFYDQASGKDAFDPEAHTVDEVNAYLTGLTDEEGKTDGGEVERVLAAEAAGKNRSGIVNGPHKSPAA